MKVEMLPQTTLMPSPQLQNFALFSQLPKELQLQIWWEAARVPRVVHVAKQAGIFHSMPGILHACRESRAAGLEVYTLLFHSSYIDPSSHQSSLRRQPSWKPKPTFFNCDRDMLQFDSWPTHKCRNHWLCDAQDLGMVTKLAVSKSLWMTTNRWVVWRDLPLFKSVRELVLVVSDGHGSEMRAANDGEMVDWSFDGSVVTLQAGRLRSAFQAEIQKMTSSGKRKIWRPDVTVRRFTTEGRVSNIWA